MGPGESERNQQPAPGLTPVPVPDAWEAAAAGRVGDLGAAPASLGPGHPRPCWRP